MSILDRLKSLCHSRKGGLLLIFVSVLATGVWAYLPRQAQGINVSPQAKPKPQAQVTRDPKTGVQFKGEISHPMIVKHEDGRVYLDFTIDTPEVERKQRSVRKSTDMIVVIDRSGSMNDSRKWPFAVRAMENLLTRLASEDRFALVSFDTHARIESQLLWMNPQNRNRMKQTIRSLRPGASTNLGQGLQYAGNIARETNLEGRSLRVLLLSDGEANIGVVHPHALNQIAKSIADRGAIISTIGMGLGFNESLMASLADFGMGTFSYLENLQSLETILAQQVEESRDVYAEGSEIILNLPRRVRVSEASGYPYHQNGTQVVIRTGQLPQGSQKNLMVTLQFPTHKTASYTLDDISLKYRVDGQNMAQKLANKPFHVACVEPSRKKEAISSVNQKVYRGAWLRNEYGSVMRKVGALLQQGDREQANEKIRAFKQELYEADTYAPGTKSAADNDLKELKKKVDDAFTGKDQRTKQNRAAKGMLLNSQGRQRSVQKNQSTTSN